MLTFLYLLLEAFMRRRAKLTIVLVFGLIDTFGLLWLTTKVEYIIELISVLV